MSYCHRAYPALMLEPLCISICGEQKYWFITLTAFHLTLQIVKMLYMKSYYTLFSWFVYYFLPTFFFFFLCLSFCLIFSLSSIFFPLLSLSSPFSSSVLHSKKERNSLDRTWRGLGWWSWCRSGCGFARCGLGLTEMRRFGCGLSRSRRGGGTVVWPFSTREI